SIFVGIWRLIMQSKNWIFLQEKLPPRRHNSGTHFCISRYDSSSPISVVFTRIMRIIIQEGGAHGFSGSGKIDIG
ncbi:MAG: hypothetical protein LBE65_06340, partial [Synergistaceae bacterium]|nr:hypothetical protein [Synergistaceae bacterium]